jgi:hypothetical protein
MIRTYAAWSTSLERSARRVAMADRRGRDRTNPLPNYQVKEATNDE